MVVCDFSTPEAQRAFAEWLDGHGRTLRRAADEARYAAARDRDGPRRLAAVVDFDETLVCNLVENADPATGWSALDSFPGWEGAPRLNPPLPGAVALLAELARLGIATFIVTGRAERLRGDTVENLERLGAVCADPACECCRGGLCAWGRAFSAHRIGPRLVMRPDADEHAPVAKWKAAERAAIAAEFRVVLVIGDQESDLGSPPGALQVRCANPFYGVV